MPKTCKECGKPSRKLSVRRLCPTCSKRRMLENIEELRSKAGVHFEKWKERREVGLRRYATEQIALEKARAAKKKVKKPKKGVKQSRKSKPR